MKIVTGSAGGRMVNSAGSPIPAGSLSTIAGGFFAGSGAPGVSVGYDPSGTLFADLSAATAATTKLLGMDIQAAESFNNIGREASQIKPLLDALRFFLPRSR